MNAPNTGELLALPSFVASCMLLALDLLEREKEREREREKERDRKKERKTLD